jgi:hypothetical protein
LPRKYHRPPAAKRRKSKKASSPQVFAPLPETGNGGAPFAPAESAPVAEAAPLAAAAEPRRAGAASGQLAGKHISKDYSYVRAEVVRIVLVAGFLIVSLVVTAILRN